MPTRLRDRAEQSQSDRKARDRAMILPLVGLILLAPPVGEIFLLDAKIAGVPFTLVYVFAVWALVIAGAAMLARRLRAGVDGAAGRPGDGFSGASFTAGHDPQQDSVN